MQALDAGLASGQIHYRLGQLAQRQSRLERASEAFQAAGAFGPVVGQDHFLQTMGGLLVNRSEFDAAALAYRRRIDVNPNNAEAHRQLAEVQFLQGRHEPALAEFIAAAWLDPHDARAHAGAGQAYVRLLKYEEAVAAFRRALLVDPSLREARYALATSLMRLGQTDGAREHMAAFERQQAEATAAGQREFQLDAVRRDASRSVLAGDHDRAIQLLTDALATSPRDARLERDLGVALLRAQRAAEALPHLEAAAPADDSLELLGHLAAAPSAAGNSDQSARFRARYQERAQQEKLSRLQQLGR
jgi:tetratricopeptide (TPR) repeat protein